VKRFQEKNLEKFEEYFSQHGFVDLRIPLSVEKIREELWKRAPATTIESGSYIDYLIHLYEGVVS
jgi:ribosome-associated translation inhibitor RaiA